MRKPFEVLSDEAIAEIKARIPLFNETTAALSHLHYELDIVEDNYLSRLNNEMQYSPTMEVFHQDLLNSFEAVRRDINAMFRAIMLGRDQTLATSDREAAHFPRE